MTHSLHGSRWHSELTKRLCGGLPINGVEAGQAFPDVRYGQASTNMHISLAVRMRTCSAGLREISLSLA